MGGFLQGLIGGYADRLKTKRDEDYALQEKDRDNRISYVKAAIASGQLTSEAMDAAVDELDQLTSVGNRKKGVKNIGGGGDILRRLLGQFTVQSNEPQKFEDRVRGSSTGTGAGEPDTSVMGEPPQRRATTSPTEAQSDIAAQEPEAEPPAAVPQAGGQTATLGEPPARKAGHVFKTAEDIRAEKVGDAEALARAKDKIERDIRARDLTEALDRINKAQTPEEKQIIAGLYGVTLKTPNLQHIAVELPNGDIRAAAFDPQSGSYLNPDTGEPFLGARPYSKPATAEQKKEDLIRAYMNTNPNVTREQAQKWADQQMVTQEANKSTPPARITITPTEGGGAAVSAITGQEGPAQATAQRILQGIGGDAAAKQPPPPLNMQIPTEGRAAVRTSETLFQDAKLRYNLMTTNLKRSEEDPNYGGQGDILLLFNHIGMTLSAQRGARITEAEIRRAISARDIPEGLLAMWEARTDRGKFLSPEQRREMVTLADEMLRETQKRMLDEEYRYGVVTKVQDANGRVGYWRTDDLRNMPNTYKRLPR